jgi:hypothetical protein
MGQTIDPGDIARDSAIAAKSNSDSSHHTDTAHFHYNYAGTGTLNNTNYLHSFVVSNALKLSLLEKSSAISLTHNWVYGRRWSARALCMKGANYMTVCMAARPVIFISVTFIMSSGIPFTCCFTG